MSLELKLSVLAHSDVLLANVLPIYYFKYTSMGNTVGYAQTFLDLRN